MCQHRLIFNFEERSVCGLRRPESGWHVSWLHNRGKRSLSLNRTSKYAATQPILGTSTKAQHLPWAKHCMKWLETSKCPVVRTVAEPQQWSRAREASDSRPLSPVLQLSWPDNALVCSSAQFSLTEWRLLKGLHGAVRVKCLPGRWAILRFYGSTY